jgi:hypothetical protein
VLKLCYIPNEPLANEILGLIKKTYATINPCIIVTEHQKQMLLFSSILRTWSYMFKEEKVENHKLHQVPVPMHPRSMNSKTCTRRYGKNIEQCAV